MPGITDQNDENLRSIDKEVVINQKDDVKGGDVDIVYGIDDVENNPDSTKYNVTYNSDSSLDVDKKITLDMDIKEEENVENYELDSDEKNMVTSQAMSSGTSVDGNDSSIVTAKKINNFSDSSSVYTKDAFKNTFNNEADNWRNGVFAGEMAGDTINNISVGISYAASDKLFKTFTESDGSSGEYTVIFSYSSFADTPDFLRLTYRVKNVESIHGLSVDAAGVYNPKTKMRYAPLVTIDKDEHHTLRIENVICEKNINEPSLLSRMIPKPIPDIGIDKYNSIYSFYNKISNFSSYNLRVNIQRSLWKLFDPRTWRKKIEYNAYNCKIKNYALGGIDNSSKCALEYMDLDVLYIECVTKEPVLTSM